MRTSLIAMATAMVASPAMSANLPASAAAAAAAQPETAAMTDAERAQAIQELRDLRSRMEALESRLGVTPKAEAAARPEAVVPISRPAGDHNLELYGFTQFDAIQD